MNHPKFIYSKSPSVKGPHKQSFGHKILIICLAKGSNLILSCALGAQKNHLTEIILLSHHHHHNQIFDKRAGASSTSVGPLPDNWLAARIADLTPDLQVLHS